MEAEAESGQKPEALLSQTHPAHTYARNTGTRIDQGSKGEAGLMVQNEAHV